MKTTLMSLVILLSMNVSFAQWTTSGTNIYNTNTGSVGIGTTAPTQTLDVRGNIYTSQSVYIDGGDLILSRTSNAFGYVVRPNTAGYKNLCFAVSGGGALDQVQLNAALTYVTGNVGIGTTSPGSNKLAVEGTIGARKVVVTATNPFPDYVFKSGYTLPSLGDVAEYIRKNGRLPGMPSADSVAKSGLDLGNTQVKLVEKVEELTLYTIALQDKVDELEAANKKLEATDKKLQDLQQQLDELKMLLRKN